MDTPSHPESAYIAEHETALLAAHVNLANFVSIVQHLRDLTERGEESERAGQLKRVAMFGTIVFSAVALEAAINWFGKSRQVVYYNDVEKSLSSLNKWRLFPRLAGREPLKEHVLERIAINFNLRDQVVHPKPRSIPVDEPLPVFMPAHGGYLVNTIEIALEAIGVQVSSADVRLYPKVLDGTLKPTKGVYLL
jgi:hypothetical protein